MSNHKVPISLVFFFLVQIDCTSHATSILNEKISYFYKSDYFFHLNAPVVISVKVKKCEQTFLFIAIHYYHWRSKVSEDC